MAVASPLKWHGGKNYLAKRIVALMPPHLTYCEPFFGGGSVLLEKDPEGISEVANDLNRDLTNFWTVLADPVLFNRFSRHMDAVPFSETSYASSQSLLREDPDECEAVSRAIAFFVACRQSLAGRMDSFAPLSRSRIRRGMNEQVSAWLTSVDGLSAAHARLKRVAITNRPAVKVINDLDHEETLYYLDPPYPKETRTAKEVYQHEMTTDDHMELLACLSQITGRFILSGYRNELYDSWAMGSNWRRIDIEIDNKAAGGTTKRKMTECLWMNFTPKESR